MIKVCFVVQRYGEEVNGGAELQCRLFAEHLSSSDCEVNVATTRAIDYMTWKDEYQSDEDVINGVIVHRFGVDHIRDQKKFDEINARFLGGDLPVDKEDEWFELQGPVSSGLIQYIEASEDVYDAYVFFTYLYYHSVRGLPPVKDKAILIPEAHDEPFIYMNKMKSLFMMPRAFFYNTEEERKLVHELFHNESIPSDIGGIGIDEPHDVDAKSFADKYGIHNYIIYVGRIDEGKNCDELFRYFIEYKKRNPSDLKLVLMGNNVISIPDHEDIIPLGFVNDADKTNGMAGARVLVLPSKFESLSMVVLEAMMLNTPVIVNGACEVLKGHCIKSNGAMYYNSYFEWEGELNYIFSHEKEMKIVCGNANEYVRDNYRWDAVTGRLRRLIDNVAAVKC